MTGVRRVARSILKYFFPLYVVALIVQVYLAGEGIFGLKDRAVQLDDAKTLDAHRGLGFFLTMPFALLLLICALLAWLPNKRARVLSLVTPFVLFLQMILASAGRWVAALHPVNAVVLLGLLGYLSYSMWTGRALAESGAAAPAMREEPATVPAA
jgi:hypothetical protein